MKVKIIIFFAFLIGVFPTYLFANTAPEVNNVTAGQRTDGSKLVDIYYDFNDADGDLCTVSVKVSDDGGLSWDVNAVSFSGDIGSGIAPCTGKHIIWDCGTDLPSEYSTNYRVKVTANDNYGPGGMVWVDINDPGVSGHESFTGYMSKYETTNAQYCDFLNAALASGDIYVSDNIVYGANGSNGGADFVGELYFNTYADSSWSQITYSGGTFTVRSRDGYDMSNHPVVEVSWYGAMAFASYYGWRLPTEWEWQAVADYDGSYIYGCGTSIDHSKANYDHYNPLGLTSYPYTSPVGYYAAYGYGMCDVAGNVWEWTDSCYYDPYESRVLRGGSWPNVRDYYCEVSTRSPHHQDGTGYNCGFRVCRDSGSAGEDSGLFTIDNRDIWFVDNDAPNDPEPNNPNVSDPNEDGSLEHPFDAIQEAIDECDDGDTVIVLTGTFTGTGNRDIDYGGKVITVRSIDPNDPNVVAATVIDCNGDVNDPHRGFIFENGEDGNSVLSGITITNGYYAIGGGMLCDESNPTITNCTFTGNSAGLGGGNGAGMYNRFSSPTLSNCTFSGNIGYDGEGGGMCNFESSPTLTNCAFSGNSSSESGGMFNRDGSSPTLTNCTFSGNSGGYGGGMANYVNSSPTLVNCTFIGNSTDIEYGDEGYGGGMSNEYNANPILIDCNFSNNSADASGGGMYNDQATPVLNNCTFSGNEATRGGGMANYINSEPILSDCNFIGNSAYGGNAGDEYGGGMYNQDSSPTLTNCVFIGNSADWGDGGGMYNDDYSDPTLSDCTFTENSADYGGGGIFNENESNPTLTKCVFSGNFADDGGGMYNEDSSPMLTNCAFSGNEADQGAGMYNGGSSPTVINCTFMNNFVWGDGAGMYNDGGSPMVTNCTFTGNNVDVGDGGGMHNEDSSPTITNCTFSGNSADDGGGMFNSGGNPMVTGCSFSGNSAEVAGGGGMKNVFSSPVVTNCTFSGNSAGINGGGMYNDSNSSPTLTNCILWGDTAASDGNEIAVANSSTIDVNYCDIRDGNEGIYKADSNCTVNWGPGNIDADPCFVNPDSNDYHLRPDSPCIDAGDPNYVAGPNETDLDGNPRIVDGNNDGNSVVDMGVYEYNPFVATFDVNDRTRMSRTGFRYECWVTLSNLSPGAVENIQLELVDVPDNMEIIDSNVTFDYIEAWGLATSEDTCTFDVNRIEPIRPAEISWRATYQIADSGESMQQMSSTVVLLEPVGLASGDITGEGVVDIDDLVRMADDWLQGSSLADIYPAPPYGDDIVNFQDFAVLAENWLVGK